MMPDPETQPAIAETMRCPTCRAAQPWSDVCRRCKCDLRLLRQVAEAYAALRRQCLWSLRRGRQGDALAAARQCFTLRDDDDARRLLAICELLNGNWASARDHGLTLCAPEPAKPVGFPSCPSDQPDQCGL